MQSKVTINERGVITIPAALRHEMGLKANDELIIERTDEGLLLRPAFSVALEFYTDQRVDDFASAEEGVAPQQRASEGTLSDRADRRLFLDANMLFLASNPGSSAADVLAASQRMGTLITSDLAVEEARKYLQVKRAAQIDDFEALLETLEIVPSVLFPLPVELQEQDAPLLCTAIRSECQFFVTADKQYFGHLYDQQVQGTEIISLLRLAEILNEIEP